MFTMIKKNLLSRTLLYWLGSATFLLACFLASCSKENVGTDMSFQLVVPSNFPALKYDIANNPITQNGFVLGRTLFYDGLLSSTNTISCGNCHQQSVAFAHADHTVSHGVFDRLGTRNSPALQNLAFSTSFMWDGGIFNLDLQPLAPIENHVEMDEKLDVLLDKLNKSDKYKSLFKNAFGTEEISSAKMLKALSQFMVMMVSANSQYDKYVRKEAGANLTGDEIAGLELFKAKCQSCHATDLFTDQTFRNNGINPTSLNDVGRYAITLNEKDKYTFKVPSLRNIEKTAPYMHDGRFRNLEAVLEHYSNGVTNSATLDPLLNANGILGIALSATEKQQIILFLKTLSDEEYIRDRRFAEQ